MTRSARSLFEKLSWWAETYSKHLQSSVHTTKVAFQAHVHAVTELYLKHIFFSTAIATKLWENWKKPNPSHF